MIKSTDTKTIKDLLLYLNYKEEKSNVYVKHFSHDNSSITVDFNNKKIEYYPIDDSFKEGQYPTKDNPAKGMVIHRNTTTNFSSDENFVCLVCVDKLLSKGYEAKHILLEPSFLLGRDNNGAYGDVLVFDKEYNPLVLIENKTYGKEFIKEWNKMQKDGGQLFSYLTYINSHTGRLENIVLYACDFDGKAIVDQTRLITLKDNDDYIKDKKNGNNPLLTFKSNGSFFKVWKETYQMSFQTQGLFEDDIAAYSVGKSKYTIDDLKTLSYIEVSKIYNDFATILRNHAITDFEHTFYILIDLFICKITDELKNPTDLQFYYKGVTGDTPKEFCGRLLKLYKQGKEELFKVEVVNKEKDEIEDIFNKTKRSLKNGLYENIVKFYEEIKFYNIKKFNFIEVENKEDFEYNFAILIDIASLIQDIRLTETDMNHFFGDLFEGLLSKSVHQTEGQFFTPMPITNFMINSLPVFPNSQDIKLLDYACGAGHFLTEFAKQYKNVALYGIEKSKQLSQVAKIATILNGKDDAHIIAKDALSEIDPKLKVYDGFVQGDFDCILANPPFSVKGFLNTLTTDEINKYTLTKEIETKQYDTNKKIECFFVERTEHFLKDNAFVAVILPISIMKGTESIHEKTRSIIFEHFKIYAIAWLGTQTFGATGTQTIVLFAQKVAKNVEGFVQTLKNKEDFMQYTEYPQFFEQYLAMQHYEREDYLQLMQDNTLCDNLRNNEIFKTYWDAFLKNKASNIEVTGKNQTALFEKSTFYNAQDDKKTQKLNKEKYLASPQYKKDEATFIAEERERHFIKYVKDIETDKLKTYLDIADNNVLVLSSPKEISQQKKFLGYGWSTTKGHEGIQYNTDQEPNRKTKNDEEDEVQINSLNYIKTPLFNPENPNDTTKLCYAIRKHIADNCKDYTFDNKATTLADYIPSDFAENIQYYPLSSLINFSKAEFNKSISEAPTTQETINYKYDTEKLGDLIMQQLKSKIQVGQAKENKTGLYPFYTSGKAIYRYDDFLVDGENIYLATGGNAIVQYYNGKASYSTDTWVISSKDKTKILNYYLYVFLECQTQIIKDVYFKGMGLEHLNKKDFLDFPIPLPNIAVQKEIVNKINANPQQKKSILESYILK